MDYHIYIHNQTQGDGGGGQPPTKPKPPGKPKPTTPKKKKPDSLMKPLAIATAALKLAEKAFVTYDSFASAATGDYRYGMMYSNYKALLGMAVNPFSVINVIRQEQQTAIANRKAEFQRELLGDAMISERTRKV